MEYIYKLNLPPITDLLLDSAKSAIFSGSNTPIHKSFKIQEMVKTEWLNFKQVPWRNLIVFYKPDYVGTIHADDWVKIRGLDEECVWGINFIHGGTGTLEYWEPEDMESIQSVPDSVGTYNVRCVTNKPARKIYTTEPGAYLVNASAIHRAKGVGKRYSIVLRPNGPAGFTWPKLVEHFGDLLI